MTFFRTFSMVAGGLALAAAVEISSPAQAGCPNGHGYGGYGSGWSQGNGVVASGVGRQFFSKWEYNAGAGYYFCTYSYKPFAGYDGYAKAICITYPTKYPGKTYFYNPEAKVFYGCYDYAAKNFCYVKGNVRTGVISQIGADGFTTAGPLPQFRDGVAFDAPPAIPVGNGGVPAVVNGGAAPGGPAIGGAAPGGPAINGAAPGGPAPDGAAPGGVVPAPNGGAPGAPGQVPLVPAGGAPAGGAEQVPPIPAGAQVPVAGGAPATAKVEMALPDPFGVTDPLTASNAK